MNDLGTIFVAGHRGMVGSAVLGKLQEQGAPAPLVADRAQLDLTQQAQVFEFLGDHRPDTVIVAAARVGGIEANRSQPAQFIYENLAISTNLIHGAYQAGIKRLLFLGSSCIYPRMAPQPITEEALLTGPLEETNEAYAIAKIAGMKLCQMYRKQYGVCFHSAMPTNLYGPGDNYDPVNSHVLPALIRKFEAARINGDEQVTLWGTGTPQREFLHVDDLAEALLHLLRLEDPPDWINVGSGQEVTIRQAAELVQTAVGAECDLLFDPSHPDGTPRKLLDTSMLSQLGWEAHIPLKQGICSTVADYRLACAEGRHRTSR